MQTFNCILRIRYYLYIEMMKLEQIILGEESNIQEMNDSSKEYYKISKRIMFLQEDLRKYTRLFKFLSQQEETQVINLRKLSSYLIKLEGASLQDKIECLCYLYNKNYTYYTNDENLKGYIEDRPDIPEKICIENFYKNQNACIILREYITEDNKVTKMKECTFEEYQKFKDVGFNNKAVDVLVDAALRNYEYEKIYSLKLTEQ